MNRLFYRLTATHKKLDDEIRSEAKRPSPDRFRLLRLKILRLAVKDRLHRLAANPHKRIRPAATRMTFVQSSLT